MASYGETVLFPEKSLYLIHKIQNGTSLGRSQWQTRPKTLRVAVPPTSSTSRISQKTIAKAKSANASFFRFVDCNIQETHPRTKKRQQRMRTPTSIQATKTSKNRQLLSRGRPQSKTVSQEHHAHQKIVINPTLGLISSRQMLNLIIPALSDSMPPSLSRHAILYINFYFHIIATDTYPLSSLLSFNPAKQHWFPCMLADDVWRYIILSFAARTIAKLTNNITNLQDAQNLLSEALRGLNHRIAAGYIQSDGTLGAIACLANWSNALGDHEKSWTHARGLAELVNMRGGLSNINERLWSKMYRGILEIAVDSDNIPDTQLLSDLAQNSGALSDGDVAVFPARLRCSCEMSIDLANIFNDISKLSLALQHAMLLQTKVNPEYMDSAVFSLLQRLLLCASQEISECHNAFRICLILYIKSLTCTIERFVLTSATLVTKLRSYMGGCLSTPTPLTRWKLFIGCLAAADGALEKKWFITSLAECLSQEMRGENGQFAFRKSLDNILWIEFVHGKHADAIWPLISIDTN